MTNNVVTITPSSLRHHVDLTQPLTPSLAAALVAGNGPFPPKCNRATVALCVSRLRRARLDEHTTEGLALEAVFAAYKR